MSPSDPRLTGEECLALAQDGDEPVILALLANPASPPHLLTDLARRMSAARERALASNPRIPFMLARMLAEQSHDAGTLRILAANRGADPRIRGHAQRHLTLLGPA